MTDQFKEELDKKAAKIISELHEAFGIQAEHKPRMMKPSPIPVQQMTFSSPPMSGYNKNNISMGRFSIVNRIRGGKVQMRHMVAEAVGYKIYDGKLIRMTPTETRRRKIAAKRSAIKRRGQVAAIVRKRAISLRKRKLRFGG